MILNDNSTQQINTLVIQLQNRITNLNNEFNKKVSEINDEISDLERSISSNENDAADMNTEIKENTEALNGKADKNHTHTKSQITDFPTSLKNPNALIINGKTYDGSSEVDAGVQTVANGGTGVTTQAAINKAFIGNLETGESDVTDGTEFVSSFASNNGFAETADAAINKPYKRQFIKVWNYIKGKISSVLGLTKDNYGGTAATILDYVKGTPIKVRWGGPGIDSAEWYPAFNADGSAIGPISRTNIHVGTADTANNGTFGMLGGAKQAESDNFEDLLNNELCSNQTGGLRGGSIDVPVGQEAKNLGIPVNKWYNFLYIPHREGSGGDNNMYGTLFVTPMTSNDGTFYIIHRISGNNFSAHRFDSAT